MVRLWDYRTGSEPLPGLQHESQAGRFVTSPAGHLIATNRRSYGVDLWDAIGGEPLHNPFRHDAPLASVVFGSQGRTLASLDWSGQTRLWALPPSEAVLPDWFADFAERIVARRVTEAGEISLLARAPDEELRDMIGRGPPELVAFARWLVDAPATRPIFPGGTLTLHDYLQSLETSDSEAGLREALRLAPLHPRLLIQLAETMLTADKSVDPARRDSASYYADKASQIDPALQSRTARLLQQIDPLAGFGPKRLEFLRHHKIPIHPFPEPEGPYVNLLPHYNSGLETSWHDGTTSPINSLFGIPRGITELAGVRFDIRGVLQLSGGALQGVNKFPWPQSVPIAINRRCQKLHFLHAAAWPPPDRSTTPEIGTFIMHFADGRTARRPIQYGRDVWDWFLRDEQARKATGLAVRAPDDPLPAWHAPRPNEPYLQGAPLRTLYLSTWENPHPETAIARLDYVSTMLDPAPFLLAITAE
jgi:hypothetical protein